jgi:hypothetical protein
MMYMTRSSKVLLDHLSSGNNTWKELNTLWKYGQTIRIWNISRQDKN